MNYNKVINRVYCIQNDIFIVKKIFTLRIKTINGGMQVHLPSITFHCLPSGTRYFLIILSQSHVGL